MLNYLNKALERFLGLKVTRISADNESRLADLSPQIRATIERARPFTMTTPERLAALCMAVEHVVVNNVPGAFVECGVWKGGSSMAAALTYQRLRRKDIELFLFDTFEGMSPPGKEDFRPTTGEAAEDLLATSDRKSEVWAYAPIDAVRHNLTGTGYPEERLHFIKGKVEDTVPDSAPKEIAILRLDTDWYESTKHELKHLFPRLSPNGILIIDDYGAWAGARQAVDEYFAARSPRPFLSRIDNTGRIYVNS